MNTPPKDLVLLSKAERMLAEATTFDEVKHIRDTAEAARGYSKKIGLSHEITVHAAAIKVTAERKPGQLLKTTELAWIPTAQVEPNIAGRPGACFTGFVEKLL